ncbi:LacI family DNA-binding transcriptional regulator [Catellatospora tritici]|uniref:LacI family DNA-binding transcriptional regulator n=1 Tax=Catellatospora tritici TaxID=2851566 RepID=UPI001C2D2235|nr:LacI family DNA-binding transcriptional regulator [Catellatospora tritici]MBV1855704.1 LacI family transcriptional regulator [Catellatospora tritici]
MPRTSSTRPPGSAATLQQVATAAGVSLATASRVLHGSGGRRVAEELAERVTAAAAELRYVAHAPAQSLARSRSTVVGVLVHDIADPYFAAIAAGAMQVAREHDLMVLVANTFRDPALERDYLARLRAQRARAVLLAGSAFAGEPFAEELAGFAAAGGRVAAIGARGEGIDTVEPDHAGGGRLVAEHLTALGHREIGVVTGPAGLATVAQRLSGFTEVVASPHVVGADFTREGGRAAAHELLRAYPRITALFALNDLMAAGVLAALREAGRSVPGEVSVVGFDDLPVATDLTPGLTTVRLDLAGIGAQAMRLMLDDEPGGRTCPAPAELVIRASTGPVRS